jgi:16S rRNA (guanine966-N2)-methyltransferase
MLTILGGAWKGRRLKALEREGLRPTASRVKASIFSIIESLHWKQSGSPEFTGWRCLDLFAGVGGLGIEVLSRGATHCVFVEKERAHAKVLKENLSIVRAADQATLFLEPVEKGSWEQGGPYDLVLLDPPYDLSPRLGELLARLPAVLAPGGIVLFEHDPKFEPAAVPGLAVSSRRTLGPAGITVLVKEKV